MDTNFYLYRLTDEGDATIYGKFPSLMMAKMSADLLLVKESCFILSGDISKMYFYENGKWDYDIVTDKGKLSFLDCYPDPREYK